MTETTPSPARLWKRMTQAQKVSAATAFWSDEEGTDDQIKAAMLIAEKKKFRPKTVVRLDLDRKARHLASLASLPDAIVARALVTYHLAEKRTMMGAFLDALGIEHEAGLIKADDVTPDPSKLEAAAATIGAQFPAEDVDLYLNTLLCQDPDTWGGLRDVPQLQGQI